MVPFGRISQFDSPFRPDDDSGRVPTAGPNAPGATKAISRRSTSHGTLPMTVAEPIRRQPVGGLSLVVKLIEAGKEEVRLRHRRDQGGAAMNQETDMPDLF